MYVRARSANAPAQRVMPPENSPPLESHAGLLLLPTLGFPEYPEAQLTLDALVIKSATEHPPLLLPLLQSMAFSTLVPAGSLHLLTVVDQSNKRQYCVNYDHSFEGGKTEI